MITRNGAVKVMDFGIARAVADGQAAVTQTAAVIGTAQYLSPEQARGEAVDARSDVYAAGCVLFELLTGEPPFTGDSPVAVAYQHVREDPKPPSALNPRVNPALDAVVLKAMSKGAANRYQSAAEMRTDLVRVLSGQRPLAPMVMTEEDRTAVMSAGRPAADRGPGRHRPAALADDYDAYDPYEGEEEERRRKRRKAWTIALIALLAVALIGVIAWLATSVFSKPQAASSDAVDLPNVVGQPLAEANRVLRDKGFGNIASVNVPCQANPDGSTGPCGPENIGNVIGTDPGPNAKVKKSDRITLRVGSQADKVAVPDVKGLSVEDATKKLKDAKLAVAPTQGQPIEVDDDKLIGKVADQNPAAGQSVAQGTSVTLTLGKGQNTIPVTDQTGQPFDRAKANLEAQGFKTDRRDVSSDQPEGTVVDQSPKTGKAKSGTVITLMVSKGDQVKLKMPDFLGRRTTVRQAAQALDTLGWNGEITVRDLLGKTCQGDTAAEAQVVNQNPGANQDISKNTPITLSVGNCNGGP
jgi:beta-lactam-binding protein with PASTA domain